MPAPGVVLRIGMHEKRVHSFLVSSEFVDYIFDDVLGNMESRAIGTDYRGG